MIPSKQSANVFLLILDVLKKHPNGISINDIRKELIDSGQIEPDAHQHLDRRMRELYSKYNIRKERRGNEILYFYEGERDHPLDDSPIDKTTRARILHRDGSRCQMCGKSVVEDKVKVHVDHKVPREWGGKTEDDNLWTLCSVCNEGKKDFFASIDDEHVRASILHKSIHVRLGELLKAYKEIENKPVPKNLLEIVAYTHDDWEKRLREIREIGWDYTTHRRKEGIRVRVYFELTKWVDWPEDPAAAIREAERKKGLRRTG